MFGFPLVSSFYPVQYGQNTVVTVVVPYVLACAIIGLLILYRKPRSDTLGENEQSESASANGGGSLDTASKSYKLGYVALTFATVAVVSYWLMTYFVANNFPLPSSVDSIVAGLIYLFSLSATVATGLPFLLIRLLPSLRIALSAKGSLKIAFLIGLGYLVTYLI